MVRLRSSRSTKAASTKDVKKRVQRGRDRPGATTTKESVHSGSDNDDSGDDLEEWADQDENHRSSDSEDEDGDEMADFIVPDEEPMDEVQSRMHLHELLQSVFPQSKLLAQKVEAGRRLKKASKVKPAKKPEEKVVEEKPAKKSKKSKVVLDDTEEEDEEAEEAEEEEKEEIACNRPKCGKPATFLFALGAGAGDEDDDMYDSDYEEYDLTENEEDDVSSCSSSRSSADEKDDAEKTKAPEHADFVPEDAAQRLALEQLQTLAEQHPDDAMLRDCLQQYRQQLRQTKQRADRKLLKIKQRNGRIFRRMARDRHACNDNEFFLKLEIDQQKKIIKELRELTKVSHVEKPYRISLLEAEIPIKFKAAAWKKANMLRSMEHHSDEYFKVKAWLDGFLRLPFGKLRAPPVCKETDGVDACHDFMAKAQRTLDEAVYGLDDAKMQILQMLGQLVTNPQSVGTAIALHGPPGTGKTSLVKEGISKILDRPFAFVALGGATDSGFLDGGMAMFVGATYGRIVQILLESQCMNPVIYFDELDKISDTPRGEEIINILMHLTDTSQNSHFQDKFFPELDLDLSKCLFIFSYNDETKVSPVLRDRMYRIKTQGYVAKEKLIIANQYLLPRVRAEVKFDASEVILPDAVIGHIVETYCQKEEGVRNLKRCLEIVHSKLNLFRLMRPGTHLFSGTNHDLRTVQVTFPLTVTKDLVDRLIKKDKDFAAAACHSMYV